jgi:HSP20 family protein
MAILPIRRPSADVPGAFDEMERMLDWWFGGPRHRRVRQGLWHPTIDIYDRADDVVAELEVPGLEAKDVDVSVEDDHLIVEGKRERNGQYADEEQYYTERAYGRFHRIVHLPTSVDPDKVVADLDGGILTVTLPKKDRAKAKKVELKKK